MEIDASGAGSAAAQAAAAAARVHDDDQAALAQASPPAVYAPSVGAPPGETLGVLARDGTSAMVLSRSAPAAQPSLPAVDGYQTGQPQKPSFHWDEDFVYNSQSPGFSDYASAAKWKATLTGASVLRPDLTDATRAYAHYWDNNGKPMAINYEKAYAQDGVVRSNANNEIARTAAAVDSMAGSSGQTSFSVTGPAHAARQAGTENWQKTIGAYQQWSSADVTVKGNQVTMTIKVHAEDHYNFNREQKDIASGAPDNANGRFTELGWAKPFDTHGEITRTVTWTLGSPPPAATVESNFRR